ncbi:hypothetical protein, partial [[Eubacterium] cellulosolvens]
WFLNPSVGALDTAAMTKWLTAQIGLNIIWGAVFGWIFSKVYELIPGKGVTKGLSFSMMVWLFFIGLYPISFFLLVYDPPLTLMAMGWGIVGFIVRIFYGLVIGALYKK